MRFLVINGPNLNLLGTREPEVYGSTTLAELDDMLVSWGKALGVEVTATQSNEESEIVDFIQNFDGDGIVLNPAAFSHTSRAIADAIDSVTTPVVEIHISNIHTREAWRAHSMVSEAAARTIYGRGLNGYRDALRHLANRLAGPFETVRYGPHQHNVGDLRRGGDHLVVFAHGGLWRQEFERDTTESLAVDLTKRGYTTWNIEYRRLGQGGGWPASGQDVLTALDSIPQIDGDQAAVTVVGHSVGAQLLMWAAPRSATKIGLHVAMGPLLDLAATARSGDVGAAECRHLLDQGAPPVMAPDGVATVLVHGDADQIVPVERSVEYAERHGLVHHQSTCDHFSLLDPTKPEWSWVVERLAAER